jgi:membrane protease YdiL (CAAX protease family)
MGKFIQISKDNRIVVIILGILLFIAFWISTIPSLQIAAYLYGFLILIALFFYTNPVMQNYVVGIPLKGSFKNMLIGALVGVAILVMPKFGLGIGVPLLPGSAESSLRWVIVCLFAPVIETVAVLGALLGFVLYLERKGKLTQLKIWIAIIISSLFFTFLHFTSYSMGWYSAPSAMGVLSQLSAVQASLISAFLFNMIMGFVITRKKVYSLLPAISGHYIVNQVIFAQIYSIFAG